MKIGVIPEQGGSLKNLRDFGQDDRFLTYLDRLSQKFEKVYYFSYSDHKSNEDYSNKFVLIKNRKLHRWLYSFMMPVFKRKEFKDCDVFRVMHMTGIIPTIIGKYLLGKPFIATYGYDYAKHSLLEGGIIRPLIFKVREKIGIRIADKVIVTNSKTKKYVSKFRKEDDILFVPNWVDTKLFRPYDGLRRKKQILYVGRVDRQKNVNLLVDALEVLGDKDARLVIIGGSEKGGKAIKTYAEKKKVNLEWAGVIPHSRLPRYYNEADIFIMPSLSEGSPKALLEAMSCGLPCIGTRIDGITDVIVDGENGLICDLSPDDMANKMKDIFENEDFAVRLRKKARQTIEERFSMDKLIDFEISKIKELVL